MKTMLRLEELAHFAIALLLFAMTPFAWWWFPLLLLTPDIGMLGYLHGPRTGAWSYNIFHHKAIALIVLAIGWYGGWNIVELTGIILFAHSAMDRMLGFGLKHEDSFEHTHLGRLQNKKDGQLNTKI